MQGFRYSSIKDKYASEASVYRVFFGKKYFIWKGKALHQSVDLLSREIDRRLRNGCKDGDMFAKVIHHIKYARISIMEIEDVYQSQNPAEILIREHELFKAAKNDELCLNVAFDPYIPKWIPENAVQEYKAATKPSPKRSSSGKKPVKATGVKKVTSRKKEAKIEPLKKPRKVAGKKGSTSPKKLVSNKSNKTPAKKK